MLQRRVVCKRHAETHLACALATDASVDESLERLVRCPRATKGGGSRVVRKGDHRSVGEARARHIGAGATAEPMYLDDGIARLVLDAQVDGAADASGVEDVDACCE